MVDGLKCPSGVLIFIVVFILPLKQGKSDCANVSRGS